MSQTYEKYSADQVTPAMLEDAALLFNEHYGTWGTDPSSSISTGKKGSPVKLSRDRLKKEYLPDNARCSYVTVTIGSRLAGNAFACRWSCDGLVVCWVTQLVIHKEFRERGLAGSLLNALRESTDGAYGLMSSHPAACLAAAKAFGGGIDSLPLEYIRENAGPIMTSSPINYVQAAVLRGNLFDSSDTSGAISSVWTKFFVDHNEPLQALHEVRSMLNWPLGDLLDGHEFLLIIQPRRRLRHKSR